MSGDDMLPAPADTTDRAAQAAEAQRLTTLAKVQDIGATARWLTPRISGLRGGTTAARDVLDATADDLDRLVAVLREVTG